MRAKVLQIHWHQQQPIFSADFEPRAPFRFATAGGDRVVRVWKVSRPLPDQQPSVEFLAGLNRHTAGVNVVRWSPKGGLLASAGDDGNILIWKQQIGSSSFNSAFGAADDVDEDQKEQWIASHILMGSSMATIYDLSWSPDGNYIAAGSCLENITTIWDIATRVLKPVEAGKFSLSDGRLNVVEMLPCLNVVLIYGCKLAVLQDHGHFIHGVAWDPLGAFLATQSSDRSVNIYSVQTGGKQKLATSLLQKSTRMEKPVEQERKNEDEQDENNSELKTKQRTRQLKLYHDENLVSFFRRLAFSPDGSILVAPAGLYKHLDSEKSDSSNHCAHIYTRGQIRKLPVAYLPTTKPALVVRFNPIPFQLRTELALSTGETARMFQLPYRHIFAVATRSTVYLYDTQQPYPFAMISNLHYAAITDMAWSPDGSFLMVASSDGFCSIVCFDQISELGIAINDSHVSNVDQPTAPVEKEGNNDIQVFSSVNVKRKYTMEHDTNQSSKSAGAVRAFPSDDPPVIVLDHSNAATTAQSRLVQEEESNNVAMEDVVPLLPEQDDKVTESIEITEGVIRVLPPAVSTSTRNTTDGTVCVLPSIPTSHPDTSGIRVMPPLAMIPEKASSKGSINVLPSDDTKSDMMIDSVQNMPSSDSNLIVNDSKRGAVHLMSSADTKGYMIIDTVNVMPPAEAKGGMSIDAIQGFVSSMKNDLIVEKSMEDVVHDMPSIVETKENQGAIRVLPSVNVFNPNKI